MRPTQAGTAASYRERIADRYRRRGLRGAASWLARKAAARAHRLERHVVIVQPLAAAVAAPPPVPDGLEFRPLRACDPAAVVAFSRAHRYPTPSGRPVAYGTRRYDGLAALRGGELVALYWWAAAASEHPDLALHGLDLASGDAYGFWLYVEPEERRRGTASRVLDAVARAAAADGHRRLYGFVLEENTAARWLFSLAGYDTVRTVPVRTVLGLCAVSPHGVFVRRLGLRGGPPFGFRRLP